MKKQLVMFVPNLEQSQQIIIAQWKTMEEAIEFARKMFWFKWDYLEKFEKCENTWIWEMDTKDYIMHKPTIIGL